MIGFSTTPIIPTAGAMSCYLNAIRFLKVRNKSYVTPSLVEAKRASLSSVRLVDGTASQRFYLVMRKMIAHGFDPDITRLA
jgi:hypothetical protein